MVLPLTDRMNHAVVPSGCSVSKALPGPWMYFLSSSWDTGWDGEGAACSAQLWPGLTLQLWPQVIRVASHPVGLCLYLQTYPGLLSSPRCTKHGTGIETGTRTGGISI